MNYVYLIPDISMDKILMRISLRNITLLLNGKKRINYQYYYSIENKEIILNNVFIIYFCRI